MIDYGDLMSLLSTAMNLQATFDTPQEPGPYALDTSGMGKGQIWVNGESIGRHWPGYIARDHNCGACNYAGSYNQNKCLTGCGEPSQKW